MTDPTEVNARGKLPFALHSSSIKTGYAAELSSSFGPGYDVSNYHQDTYGFFENEPLQGPFTEAHVGGNQHRHAPLNGGTDTIMTRAEVFHIDLKVAAQMRLFGPETFDTLAPRASLLRGNTAKAPVNLTNIRTTIDSKVHGNYTHDYEVVQSSGRAINNRHFVEAEGISASLTTQYIVDAQVERTLPVRSTNKNIIVERFNAPGGTDVSSRGVLDPAAEEYAPNNALPYRNKTVRQAFQAQLTSHTRQFGSSSVAGIPNFHKVARNTLKRMTGSSKDELHDNWHVQHELPQNDLSYSWITASAITTPYELGGHQRDGAFTNRGGAFTDISFNTSSLILDGAVETLADHIGIDTIEKKFIEIDPATNIVTRDRNVFTMDGSKNNTGFTDYPSETFAIDIGPGAERWNKIIGTGGSKRVSLSIWFKLKDFLGEPYRRLFDFGSSGGRFSLQDAGGGIIQLFLGTEFSTTRAQYSTTGSSGISLNEWHHAALTYNMSAAIEPTIYINGISSSLKVNTVSAGSLLPFENECFVGGAKLGGSSLVQMNGNLAEFSIYDDLLTATEVLSIYSASKGEDVSLPPKPYNYHSIANNNTRSNTEQYIFDVAPSIAQKVVAWYSYDRNDDGVLSGTTFIGGEVRSGKVIKNVIERFQWDAIMGRNVTIENISNLSNFSLYNGPYQHSSWKQVRTGEHPVNRYFRDNNIISVANAPREILLDERGKRKLVKAKRSNESTNFIEPPVSSKYKPMRHNVLLKGSVDEFSGHQIKHTYNNNLAFWANKGLDKAHHLVKNEEQIYDRMQEFMYDSDRSEADNPISKLLSFYHNEVIFPKEENTFLGRTRGRKSYILDMPGFSGDGYDSTFGSQRAFWRDKKNIRQRTSGISGALNSQGYSLITKKIFYLENSTIEVNSNGDLSLYPLESSSNLTYQQYSASNTAVGETVLSVIASGHGGELNNQEWHTSRIGSSSATSALTTFHTIKTRRGTWQARVFIQNYHQKPQVHYMAFLDGWYYDTSGTVSASGITSSFDSGLQWRTSELSGKNPWYDSYEDYSSDIRVIGPDYSIVPEYNISEHMDYYVRDNGGNFRVENKKLFSIDGASVSSSAKGETLPSSDDFYSLYAHSDLLKNGDKVARENKENSNASRITLKCSGVKKLLPQNGFYPSQRTVQLASLFSSSIGTYIDTGLTIDQPPFTLADVVTTGAKEAPIQALLQSFFAPGIMYNSIKSGLAVDFPVFTGSHPSTSTGQVTVLGNNNNTTPATDKTYKAKGFFDKNASMRMPFESLLNPTLGIPKQDSIVIEGGTVKNAIFLTYPLYQFSTFLLNDYQPFFIWSHKRDFRYEMAISNFMAEVPRFFLKDESLTSFTSKISSEWEVFDENRTYYMDVVLRKDNDLVMMESYRGQYHETGALGQRATGRYFGYPFNISSSNPAVPGIYDYSAEPWAPGAHCDPAYAPYTPPYHEGEAIARLSFKPASGTKKYTLDEVFSGLEVENIFNGMNNYSASVALESAMPVDSSVNYLGKVLKPSLEFDLQKEVAGKFVGKGSTDSQGSDNLAWSISTKWECPVLDFSSQEGDIENEIVTTGSAVHSLAAVGNDFSGSGFGRGMWSGYGEIPSNKGIYLEVKDSYPQRSKGFVDTTSASLLQHIGMAREAKKVGQIAAVKEISEAIIAIPFLDAPQARTVEINCHHLIKINKDIFKRQRQNFSNAAPAIKKGDLGSKIEINSTSITKMIDSISRYVLPPEFNFMQYDDIDPFVMYMFEFKHNLDSADLSDIWQGVMPKIAMTAERDEIEFSHPTGEFEFFGAEGLPENLRWLVFKVKKKAESDYSSITADTTDDKRFKFDFEIGRKKPEYSYNYPYDFFSLVELAKIEVELEYSNNEKAQKVAQSRQLSGPAKARENTIAKRARNIRTRGKK